MFAVTVESLIYVGIWYFEIFPKKTFAS